MKIPIQAQPVIRNVSTANHMNVLDNGITASGCSTWTAVGCAASLAACGAVCYGSGGLACAPCLAAIGASSCMECLT
jgi:hypothetical protein